MRPGLDLRSIIARVAKCKGDVAHGHRGPLPEGKGEEDWEGAASPLADRPREPAPGKVLTRWCLVIVFEAGGLGLLSENAEAPPRRSAA